MFDKESWLNSYTTIIASWCINTIITFEQTVGYILKEYFGMTGFDSFHIKTPDDILKFLTWVVVTSIAVASGISKHRSNEADTRLKNAEATAIERGYSAEDIENIKTLCNKESCYFVKFYRDYYVNEMEEKLRKQIGEDNA